MGRGQGGVWEDRALGVHWGRLPDPQPRKVASVREVGRQPPIEPTKALPAGIWELTLAQETL